MGIGSKPNSKVFKAKNTSYSMKSHYSIQPVDTIQQLRHLVPLKQIELSETSGEPTTAREAMGRVMYDFAIGCELTVAYIGQKPVGFVTTMPDSHGVFLFTAVVDPAHRRNGTRKALYEAVINDAAEQSLDQITTRLKPGDREMNMFIRMGFDIVKSGNVYEARYSLR